MPKSKIRIVQSIAGHAEPMYEMADFSFRPGEEVEIPDKLADAWIASGVAEPCAELAEAPKKSSAKK